MKFNSSFQHSLQEISAGIIQAVIRGGIRSRLCNPDQTTLAEMIEQADDVLFSQALKKK